MTASFNMAVRSRTRSTQKGQTANDYIYQFGGLGNDTMKVEGGEGDDLVRLEGGEVAGAGAAGTDLLAAAGLSAPSVKKTFFSGPKRSGPKR